MTFPISPKDQSYLVSNLSLLQSDEEAFYGQLFPDVYPSDILTHAAYKDNPVNADYYFRERSFLFGQYVRSVVSSGVDVKRLRGLPGTPNGIIGPMISMCQVAESNGENVRVCRIDQQLGRMAMAGIDGNMARQLLSPVPRGSFWALSYRNRLGGLSMGSVAMIEYAEDGSYPGLAEYSPPDRQLQKYVEFWRDVHSDAQQSRTLSEWHTLYNE